ncbi:MULTISPECIES: dTMP kinase [Ralstonia solanacearum species complex]|uniref:Thymidylate kinase n=3 Tax=Ralstonia solanacearum species complex TaxID=3116862 RepID=KTHY_RALN1|nr:MULTISPECIES: dTMP kinase [Ralstonia]Q8XYH4.1 RecName: Full=Thymidylate kinase; AltName: Full=dTMP kinase [Ralstonia pseudosolanacearum GMI1000]AKZ26233.1 thymidylate kinase [Ralstonia solanacearum]APC68538.1 thymidylate kinase [Ralstonia solanacearum OE1-1]AGH84121.1 Thymidylate kinase [Ralstonia pseudosolanacearum FQY_4]ANH33076.1 thymidylate kinase [Ralstonia solanacearum]API74789.1 dTMP kinase [Ralstonia pseudosolanacearum]
MTGKFITFEGIDGAGKSTHLAWFAQQLEARLAPQGRKVVVTREPGGTPLGERLREVLLHERMHLETEALLMFASRREHIAEVIQPALERGDWVISDRFTDATFAYQGGGRGLAIERLEALEQWVQQGLQPTRTLLFDLAPEVAAARLADARTPDKFEAESAQFFVRTRAEYLRRAAAEPGRFVVIDAARARDDIRKDLEKLLASL